MEPRQGGLERRASLGRIAHAVTIRAEPDYRDHLAARRYRPPDNFGRAGEDRPLAGEQRGRCGQHCPVEFSTSQIHVLAPVPVLQVLEFDAARDVRPWFPVAVGVPRIIPYT